MLVFFAPDSRITVVDVYKSIMLFVGIQAAFWGIVMVFSQI